MLPILAISFGLDSLVTFLIALIVIAIVLYAVRLVLGMLSLPPPVQQLVWLVIAVVILIILLGALGIVR